MLTAQAGRGVGGPVVLRAGRMDGQEGGAGGELAAGGRLYSGDPGDH